MLSTLNSLTFSKQFFSNQSFPTTSQETQTRMLCVKVVNVHQPKIGLFSLFKFLRLDMAQLCSQLACFPSSYKSIHGHSKRINVFFVPLEEILSIHLIKTNYAILLEGKNVSNKSRLMPLKEIAFIYKMCLSRHGIEQSMN